MTTALGLLKWTVKAGKNGKRLRIAGRQYTDPEGLSVQKLGI